ncbi:MAG: hypothetical protein ACFCUV_07090, partial [Rivularia sp. (in: cyanobacteria)]
SFDTQIFNIVVRNNNTAPNLSPIPNLTFKEAETLELQLQATDSDGDKPTYFATNLPQNASLNPETGLLKQLLLTALRRLRISPLRLMGKR